MSTCAAPDRCRRQMIATLSRVAEAAPAGAADAPWRTGADAHAADDHDRHCPGDIAAGLVPAGDRWPARKRWPRWSLEHCKRAKAYRRSVLRRRPIRAAAGGEIARSRRSTATPARSTALQKAATATPGLKPVKAEARDLFRRPLMPQEMRDYDAVVFDPPRQGAQAQAHAACRQQDSDGGRGVLQRRDVCARCQAY